MSLYYNVSDWNEPDPQWLSNHRALLEVSSVRTVLADGQNIRQVILTLQLIGVRHFKWNTGVTDYKNSSRDSVTVTQHATRWNSIFIFPAAVCHDMWWSVGKICLRSGSWNTGVMIQFHTSAQYTLQVLRVLYSTPFCYLDTKRLYIRNHGGLDSNCDLRFSLCFKKRGFSYLKCSWRYQPQLVCICDCFIHFLFRKIINKYKIIKFSSTSHSEKPTVTNFVNFTV